MFTSALALLSHYDEFGRYLSPNICFMAKEGEAAEEEGDAGGDGADAGGDEAEGDGAEEGDEAEGEDEADGEGEGEEEGDEDAEADEAEERPAARSGRANERIRRLAAENKRLKESDRRLNDMLARGPRTESDPRAAQREYEAAEKARLDEATQAEQLGSTGAVARYWAERNSRETNARIQASENRAFEREDAREFRQICREDGISATLREWVETNVQTARANGNYALTREALLNHRLGQLARLGKAERLGKQQERGNRRIIRQTVKAPRGGSDVQRASGRRKRESEWTAEDYERQLSEKPLIQR